MSFDILITSFVLGKPQGGSTLGSSGGGGNGRKERRPTFESVSEAPPTPQSLLGPLPTTTAPSSSPYGSVKKGKAATPLQTERAQKGNQDSTKKRKGSGERNSPNADSAPQQVCAVLIIAVYCDHVTCFCRIKCPVRK